METKKIKFSTYNDLYTPATIITLEEFTDSIKSSEISNQIEHIREVYENGDEDKSQLLKKKLPGVTVSGIFKDRRNADNISEYSQLVILDIDKLDKNQVVSIKNKSKIAPYTVASFISPRGRGLKIIVRVDSNAEHHKLAISQVKEYYRKALELELDDGDDICRLCFMSYDKDCYSNFNANVFNVDIQAFEEEKNNLEELQDDITKQRTQVQTKSSEDSIQTLSTFELLERCIKFTEKKSQYIEGNRNNFIYMFASNANRFGIDESDTLDFCLTNFDLDEREIKSSVKSAYKHHSHEFAKFAKFANDAKLEKAFDNDENSIKDSSILNNTLSIPESVYESLPALFQLGIKYLKTKRDKDVFLTGAFSIISGCLPNVTGLYHGKEVYPNLYAFILAPAASGKGSLTFSKMLADKYHDEVLSESKNLQEEYKQELEVHKQTKKYLKKGELPPPPPEEPVFKVVFIPANTSNAKMMKHLEDNEGFGIVCETEADTLGQVFKNEWGSYSDLLRKAYHHERISSSRKTNNEYFEINNPRISAVLSGTPNQILNIIDSAEDGLFSRFMFYVFSSEPIWLDPSPKANPVNLTEHYKRLSKYVLEMVRFFESSPTNITLSEEQWDRFNPLFNEYLFRIYNLVHQEATSIVKRLGLIVFRFCMMFTAMRKYENKMTEMSLECTDQDFENAILLANMYLEHSILVYNSLPNNSSEIVFKSATAHKFYDKLPKDFQRKEAVDIGNKMNLSERTVDGYLSKLEKASYLSKPKAGFYIKMK
ncbi:DUF3987 domain-containing protein [Mesohalobacter halotolerans]|uniref:DUF3987 domain-containing protein n=1 Tax=Mesohalobacter halotolerans TaxID=1883405 RepID=A0A4U5TV23_9FLAO|nr:DUF3987 domain-containing protein [Mesohalobacter halotolerans]TKS57404.1 DUF3987 domain-containing protein [Mesohalobacter halotolerans]